MMSAGENHKPARSGGLCWVLILVSLLVALVGVLLATQATMGVALVAGACYLAILARIAQAVHLHKGGP